MIQDGLFAELNLSKPVWAKGEMVLSVDTDQTRILRNIMRLYNGGEPFDVDVTYSKGVFYKKLPQPRYKFDIEPQAPGVEMASADALPLAPASVGSVVFDPPFKASHSTVRGIIERRFRAFKSVAELWGFYDRALQEFWRVLRPRGIVVFKCQDTVSSGVNWMSHYQIEKSAEQIGFATLDLFVLRAHSVIWSPNMVKQKHARKAHSFFFVFQKPKRQ